MKMKKMSWLGKGALKVDQNQVLLDEWHQNSCVECKRLPGSLIQSLLKLMVKCEC